MKRSLLAILLLVSGVSFSPASHADGGHTAPLCPDPASPDCVVSNWGQTGPDGVDTGMAPHRGDPVASARASNGSQKAIQMLPVAAPATNGLQPTVPLKTVISPQGLFPKETAELTAAIKRARFNPDGSIATGKERIASAAAAAARAAGTRYTLTLYVKVPQRLKPDESGSLNKKVQSINDVLAGPADGSETGKPRS